VKDQRTPKEMKVNYRLRRRSKIFCGEGKAVFNWIYTWRLPKCVRVEHRQPVLRSIVMYEN